MKSVLISIQPKWCELIASGKKTIEVRKTKPKLQTPFKCYIYCTKAHDRLLDIVKDGDEVYGETHHGKTLFIKGEDGSVCDMYGKRQKVIGEFICDRFIPIVFDNGICYATDCRGAYACMTVGQAVKYGKGKPLYGWHISDLVIYDEPKELSEFATVCEGLKPYQCDKCEYSYTESNESIGIYHECCCNNLKPLKRPPQSWCYAERKDGADNE